jgi:CheY-like chemotaxis protein
VALRRISTILRGFEAVTRATILVVDDDPLIAFVTAGLLRDLGHDVIETLSGAKAVAVLEGEQRVDLMITDFSMPEMTGLQLAKVALRLRPDLKILLTTGYAELPGGETTSLPLLEKPYGQSELAVAIVKLLAPTDR